MPHLRSITDTSYFPTDEIDQAPAEAVVADPDAAQKDLAFLGYEICSALLLSVTHTSRQVYLQAIHDFSACCLMLRLLVNIYVQDVRMYYTGNFNISVYCLAFFGFDKT